MRRNVIQLFVVAALLVPPVLTGPSVGAQPFASQHVGFGLINARTGLPAALPDHPRINTTYGPYWLCETTDTSRYDCLKDVGPGNQEQTSTTSYDTFYFWEGAGNRYTYQIHNHANECVWAAGSGVVKLASTPCTDGVANNTWYPNQDPINQVYDIVFQSAIGGDLGVYDNSQTDASHVWHDPPASGYFVGWDQRIP